MIGDTPDSVFLKARTVLFVEDDPGALASTSEFLERRVGALHTATHGEEGLEAFRNHGADIVVTDIQMPGMDGLTMARHIRQLDPEAQIVVTTAFEQTDYLTRAIDIGIDQYVLKPILGARLEFSLLTCARRLRLRSEAPPTLDALSPEEQDRLAGLTPRERQVLTCLSRGLPSQEIAQGLGISLKTVHTHLAHLMVKLGIHKSTALAVFAVRAGLI